MNRKIRPIAIALLSLWISVAVWAQNTVYTGTNGAPSISDLRTKFPAAPLLINPLTGRLLVDVGSVGTFSLSDASLLEITNVNIASISAAILSLLTNINMGTIGGVAAVPTTDAYITNAILTVGGLTYVSSATMAVDSTAAGIAANDVLSPVLTFTGAVRTNGATGLLKCVTISTGDNNAPAIRLLISGAALTWPVTNAVADIVMSEASNIQGIVDFAASDFKQIGTNYFATKDVSVGIKPAATSLFIYPVCTAAITNTNSATIKLTIFQD